jgi:hypothetical protein
MNWGVLYKYEVGRWHGVLDAMSISRYFLRVRRLNSSILMHGVRIVIIPRLEHRMSFIY